MNSGILLFGSLTCLIALNIPISLSLGLSSIITLIIKGIPLSAVPSLVESTVMKFTLLTIPFFILAGTAMEMGGISKRLIALANKIIGGIKGGLGYVVVITSMFFAAISGSGPATVAAVGSVLIPAMVEQNYDASFSAALVAISGSLGTIIPPSISFIVYGMIAGVSIGELFIAGVLPGILLGVGLIIIVCIFSIKNNWKSYEQRGTTKEILSAFIDAFWGIISPIIVLGGIYSGLFTPTEAAAVAAVYSIFVGVFIYKEIKYKDFIKMLSRTAIATGIIMLIVANAGLFSWVLAREGIAIKLANYALSITTNKFTILLMLNIIFLAAGCVMDGVSAMYILVPIILPICQATGIDPLFLGVILVVNLSIGQVTPPVGPNLYLSADIAGVSLTQIIKSSIPFLVAGLVVLLILTMLPQVSLFLPSIMK